MNSSKALKFVLPILLIGIIATLLFRIISIANTKQELIENYQKLPALHFYDLKGGAFMQVELKQGTATVIIYFNTECEHCQYEAEAIRENIEDFEEAAVLMISDESREILQSFAEEYQLSGLPNLHVLADEQNRFKELFGTSMVPSIFIYDKDQKLIKHFKGETKTEAILNYLNNNEALKTE